MNAPRRRRRLAGGGFPLGFSLLAIVTLVPGRDGVPAAPPAQPDEAETAREPGGPPGDQPSDEPPLPEKYTLDYPVAERFCPPVRSTFYDATRTLSMVGRRTFRHPPNGNFGYTQRVQGKSLVHVGADLSLFRVGEPVFAVAHGVVRISTGPAPPDKRRKTAGGTTRNEPPAEPEPQKKPGVIVAPWGNMIAIEHRLPSGEFVTTIYGHLGTDRLVKAGDVVRAGQQIGEIGRQHPFINGGYEPHLHFGVKQGRLAEVGRGVLPLDFGDGPLIARIAAVREDDLELDPGRPLPEAAGDFRLTMAGRTHTFRRRGDRYVVSAGILWATPSTPEFPLVGHASSTDGFYDPVAFLRRQQADSRPAPFLFAKGAK